MNELFKYGLIAVGGYFLYEYFYAAPTSVTPVVTTSAVTNPSAAIQATTKQLVSNAALNAKVDPTSYQSVDVWNYLYNSVRGIAGPSPESLFPGVDRNKLYSIDEWWSAMTGAGFSGLGVIANHVNPYWDRPQGIVAGNNVSPNGMEKYIIRMN
jgi:hypothetical protein